MLLDHIYMKNVANAASSTSTIKFTGTYPIVSDGKSLNAHLSDHYGVQVTVPLN
jgi:endonuclease/exonuclease/phosphatase family metal-dependent hydrolase